MNLNELNEKIMFVEKDLMEKEITLSNLKRTLEIAKLTFKESLDKKEFSNDQKREFACLSQPAITSQMQNIDVYEHDIELAKIETRYKLREFNILLKSELI